MTARERFDGVRFIPRASGARAWRRAGGGISIIAGCLMLLIAAAQADAQAHEQALQQRVEARWDALLERDYESAYAFFSPTYRAVFSLEQFMRGQQTGLPVVDAEVAEIKIGDPNDGSEISRATAVVNVAYQASLSESVGMTDIINTYREQWLRRDGEWWYVPDD